MAGMIRQTGIDVLNKQHAAWYNPNSQTNNPDFYATLGVQAPSASLMNQYRAQGYEWDSVKRQWVRSPTSAGQRVAQFGSAAMGGLTGGGTGGGATGASLS